MYSQILTGEDWNVVMYDGIQAYGGVKVGDIDNIIMTNLLSNSRVLDSWSVSTSYFCSSAGTTSS